MAFVQYAAPVRIEHHQDCVSMSLEELERHMKASKSLSNLMLPGPMRGGSLALTQDPLLLPDTLWR